MRNENIDPKRLIKPMPVPDEKWLELWQKRVKKYVNIDTDNQLLTAAFYFSLGEQNRWCPETMIHPFFRKDGSLFYENDDSCIRDMIIDAVIVLKYGYRTAMFGDNKEYKDFIFNLLQSNSN